MKEALALTMFCSLALFGIFALAGFLYEIEGYGLHPLIAGLGALLSLAAGYFAAALLEKIE